MPKTIQFLVTVVVNHAVKEFDMADHIQDSVKSWGGQYTPDDLFFPTNIKEVTTQWIRPISEKKK